MVYPYYLLNSIAVYDFDTNSMLSHIWLDCFSYPYMEMKHQNIALLSTHQGERESVKIRYSNVNNFYLEHTGIIVFFIFSHVL